MFRQLFRKSGVLLENNSGVLFPLAWSKLPSASYISNSLNTLSSTLHKKEPLPSLKPIEQINFSSDTIYTFKRNQFSSFRYISNLLNITPSISEQKNESLNSIKPILKQLEWKREPEAGWKIIMAPYYYGDIVYQLNSQDSEFQKIVIIFSVGKDFEINFQKPKSPLLFEKCLEKFHFAYESIQKEIKNYNILKIDFNKLTELLVHLHENKYISQQLLHDINLAVSPENTDLIKLKKSKEIDSQMPVLMFSSPEARQNSFDKNLHDYVCNINMKLYSMKPDDISYALLTIENLLKENADPNRTMSYKTPLIGLIINQPCNDNTKQIANLLVQYGAKLDATDIHSYTVLHHAVLSQNKLWVTFLLEVGADAKLTDKCGNTPRQVYHNHCKSDNLTVDAEIENMLATAETTNEMKLSK